MDYERSIVESNEFVVKEGFIQYGATVKLVCSMTNQALPYLVRMIGDSIIVLFDGISI